MTLANTLRQKLHDGPAFTVRQVVQAADGAWSAHLTADRGDDLSCLAWELQLRGSTPAAASLREWSEQIANKVTSLLEPLKLLELDGDRNEALLRSENPLKRDDQVFYFEMVLAGTQSARLRRYRAQAEGPAQRQQIPFPLTNEAVVKLVEDVLAGK